MHGGEWDACHKIHVLLHPDQCPLAAEGPVRRAPELKRAGRAGAGKTDPIFDRLAPSMLHLRKMLQPARRSPCRS